MRCLAGARRPGYSARPASRILAVAVLALGSAPGCATRAPLPAGPPRAEAAAAAVDATALRQPARFVFSWSLRDGEARFSGDGVARTAPPHHARLDLFGPRGEGYVSAALVDMELRLPTGADPTLLPPAPLLWSVLGVFREPQGAVLVGTDLQADTVLVYERGSERWRFRVTGGVVRGAEWEDGRRGRRTVEVREVGTLQRPSLVVYRDWQAYRELSIEVEEAEYVAAFPPETWTPGSS